MRQNATLDSSGLRLCFSPPRLGSDAQSELGASVDICSGASRDNTHRPSGNSQGDKHVASSRARPGHSPMPPWERSSPSPSARGRVQLFDRWASSLTPSSQSQRQCRYQSPPASPTARSPPSSECRWDPPVIEAKAADGRQLQAQPRPDSGTQRLRVEGSKTRVPSQDSHTVAESEASTRASTMASTRASCSQSSGQRSGRGGRAALYDTWAKGLKPSSQSRSDCRFHMPAKKQASAGSSASGKCESEAKVAGLRETPAPDASCNKAIEASTLQPIQEHTRTGATRLAWPEVQGVAEKQCRQPPSSNAARRNGREQRVTEEGRRGETASEETAANGGGCALYIPGSNDRRTKVDIALSSARSGHERDASPIWNPVPATCTRSRREREASPIVGDVFSSKDAHVAEGQEFAARVQAERSAMFEMLTHPQKREQHAEPMQRDAYATTSELAGQGRSPEMWKPSLEAGDRLCMDALLKHKAEPQKYPYPQVREGKFVSWSSEGKSGSVPKKPESGVCPSSCTSSTAADVGGARVLHEWVQRLEAPKTSAAERARSPQGRGNFIDWSS